VIPGDSPIGRKINYCGSKFRKRGNMTELVIGKIILISFSSIFMIFLFYTTSGTALFKRDPENAEIKPSFELRIRPAALLIVTGLFLLIAFSIPAEQDLIAGTLSDSVVDNSSLPQGNNNLATSYGKLMFFLLYWFLPGFFIIAGFILIVVGARTALRMISSLEWKRTNGIIIQSKLKTFKKFYYPEIKYEFHVNDKRYESEIFIIGKAETTDDYMAKQAIEEYPKGKKLTVYYNPKNPNECSLKPGSIDKGELIMLFAGGALFIFFGWIVTVALRKGWFE
jgi:hypothetical protein